MKKKGLNITFLFLVYQLCVYSQIDTLNNFNEKGKKHGYWKCYLNKEFNIVDSAKALYIGFNLYDCDQKLSWVGERGRFPYDSVVPKLTNSYYKNSKIKVLDGKIFFYKNGIVVYEENYSRGLESKIIVYFDESHKKCLGEVKELHDFNKKYNNTLGSYYSEIKFCDSGKYLKFWFRKGKRKWKSFKIKE